MKKVAIFLVVVGVAVFFRMRNQSDDSAQIIADMKELITSLDAYQANADFLDQSLERSHRRAFEDAYDMGGRRQRATFDEDKYIKDVLTLMIRDCNQSNKRDLVDTLMQVREVLLAEE